MYDTSLWSWCTLTLLGARYGCIQYMQLVWKWTLLQLSLYFRNMLEHDFMGWTSIYTECKFMVETQFVVYHICKYIVTVTKIQQGCQQSTLNKFPDFRLIFKDTLTHKFRLKPV